MEIIFTEHVKDRIRKRKISEDEIINTIKYAEKTDKRGSKYFAKKNIERGKIEVVYTRDKYIKIVTVYWI